MKLSHEDTIVAIWRAGESWKHRAYMLQGAWGLMLRSDAETEREVNEKFDALGDMQLLMSIAWEHTYTDRALAA